MAATPNPVNYYLGKGILKFKPQGQPDYYDLGNAPVFQVQPQVTKLDHFSARLGTKFKDLSVVSEKQCSCTFTLEEFTTENLSLALMGELESGQTIDILSLDEVRGAVRFVGTNTQGEKCQVDLPNVSLTPGKAIDFIGDAWGSMDFSGDVLADSLTGSFGTVIVGIDGEVDAGSDQTDQ